MKKGSLSILFIAALTLTLLVSACGGGKATTSTKPPTTTTKPPTTTTTNPPTTTTKPPTTTSGGSTLPTTAIAITTHTAVQLAAYKGLCQMCHGPGLSNSNPYPPTWDGKANGSTQNTGVYTITPGSPADHTSYTADQCTQAGCHVAPGSTTTPPTTTTTTPPTSTTTTPPTTTASPNYFTISLSGLAPKDTITVKVGTAVTWTNGLEGDATILSTDGTFGGLVVRSGTYTYTFTKDGTYTFSIAEEPDLKGTIIVTA